MENTTNQQDEKGHDANIVLAVSGFDWNKYRSTIWLANAHVNDERFLRPEKVGVLIADIKKLLHIIHEAQEAACASSGEAQGVCGGGCTCMNVIDMWECLKQCYKQKQ